MSIQDVDVFLILFRICSWQETGDYYLVGIFSLGLSFIDGVFHCLNNFVRFEIINGTVICSMDYLPMRLLVDRAY